MVPKSGINPAKDSGRGIAKVDLQGQRYACPVDRSFVAGQHRRLFGPIRACVRDQGGRVCGPDSGNCRRCLAGLGNEEKPGRLDLSGFDGEHVQRARLRIDSRKWLMSKMAPKKYGDRIEVGGNSDTPLRHCVQVEFVKAGSA